MKTKSRESLPIIVRFEWFDSEKIKPEEGKRVIVWVHEFECRKEQGLAGYEPVHFGRYHSFGWKIDNSPSDWYIPYWAEVPSLP